MERTQEVIIDASVVIKWFSQEEGSERAVQVRNDHIEGKTNLIAPDLLIYEILNALRFKKGFDAPTVAQAVNDLLDLRLDIMTPIREVTNKSSELAYKYDITSYDSYYLALGETLGIKVLTADDRLYKKAKECKFLSLL
jgi:predicted nucleic acid-binding protein